MKGLCVGLIGVLLGWACAAAQDNGGGKSVHLETSFDVRVHAPVAETTKLFTPEGERAWAGEHWNPQYVYAAGPTRDAAGAVFTIQHGLSRAVWIVTRRDDRAREYDYAYFIPDVMITSIRVTFEPVSADTTNVRVTYERTALSPEGEAHVAAMARADKAAGVEWQSAIDKYIAAKTTPARY
jgi:hypothetical protein